MNVTYKTRPAEHKKPGSAGRCRICGALLQDSIVVEAYLVDPLKPVFGFEACADHQGPAIEAAVKWQVRWLDLNLDGQPN